jgi:DNA-binding CsgD family transcriptional regulator
VDEFLEQLAQRLQIPEADIIAADEVAEWPDGKIDELVSQEILTEVEPAKGAVCNECEENCFIEPNLRTYPDDGKTIGIFVCTRNPDIGRIEVDLNRLKRWRIDKDKLVEFGFIGKKSTKKRRRKRSSNLTDREKEVYTLIHVQGKTQKQAAMEMGCSTQNVSKLLKNAEEKMKAQTSRSVNLHNAQKLPEDKRGQIIIKKKDF